MNVEQFVLKLNAQQGEILSVMMEFHIMSQNINEPSDRIELCKKLEKTEKDVSSLSQEYFDVCTSGEFTDFFNYKDVGIGSVFRMLSVKINELCISVQNQNNLADNYDQMEQKRIKIIDLIDELCLFGIQTATLKAAKPDYCYYGMPSSSFGSSMAD
jgi:hypothetical protein